MEQKDRAKNRLIITSVVLLTFFFIMLGIGTAILGDGDTPSINQEWKEILLLVLGAFLGSYSRIIDFWFNGSDTNIDGRLDAAPAEPCDCDEPDDELDNLY
ncbi:hypothetical protein PQZ39_00070 [bacterium]|nr:hypothetical protein [bacterium]